MCPNCSLISSSLYPIILNTASKTSGLWVRMLPPATSSPLHTKSYCEVIIFSISFPSKSISSCSSFKGAEAMLLEGKDIEKIITSQYDLVCNGLEVAGGSIRTHKPEVLEAVFKIMGYKEEEIKEQFGHMLEAFTFGAPPHGGCAQGFERLLMAYLKEEYLREVQAFPQTGQGRTSVMDAPSELSEDQLKELHLKVQNPSTKLRARK